MIVIFSGRQGCGCPVDTSAFLCRSTDRAGRRDRRPLRLPYCNGIVRDNLSCTVLDLPQYITKQTSTRQRRISLCDVIAKFHRLRFHTAQPYITEHRVPSPVHAISCVDYHFLIPFFYSIYKVVKCVNKNNTTKHIKKPLLFLQR